MNFAARSRPRAEPTSMSNWSMAGFLLVVLSVACGGAPGSPPTAPNPSTQPPSGSSDPLTESERSTLAAVLGDIAVDAIEQAIPEIFADPSSLAALSGIPSFAITGSQLAARYGIFAEHQCSFPNLAPLPGTIRSTGSIEVNWAPQTSGTITATLTMSTRNSCTVGLGIGAVNLGPRSWELDTSGLKVTSTLEMMPNGMAKRQVFRLQGTLFYFSGPYRTSMPINLTHAYEAFPRQPVSASGQFGDMDLNRTLPQVERLPRVSPSPSTLTSRWTGSMEAEPDPRACPVEWHLELNLQANDHTLSGTAITRNTKVVSSSCSDVVGHVASYGISGTAERNGNISFTAAGVFTFHGTYSETRISGRFAVAATGQPGNFAVSRQ